MGQSRKILVSILLFALSLEICLAQHWSYGLQPGGKRSAENLAESFQESANENGEGARQSDCPGSYQRPGLSDLEEALESLIKGEARRKKM